MTARSTLNGPRNTVRVPTLLIDPNVDPQRQGDVMHIKVLDKHILILNSFEAVDALLEKRSAKYSSKPQTPMLIDL